MVPMTTMIVIVILMMLETFQQTLQQFLFQGDSRRSEKMQDEEDVLAGGERAEQGERGEHDTQRISSEI